MFDDFPTKEGCRTISHADSFGMGGIDYTDSVNYIKGTDKISEQTTWYIDGRARKTVTVYHDDGTYDRTIVDGVEEKIDGNHHRVSEKSRHEEHGVWNCSKEMLLKMLSELEDDSSS